MGNGQGQSLKGTKIVEGFLNKFRHEVNFEQGNEVWLNIKKICLPEGLNHEFLGPYVGPFKVLEKKIPNIFKLEL